jgi:ATP-dependent DNA helicase DinG
LSRLSRLDVLTDSATSPLRTAVEAALGAAGALAQADPRYVQREVQLQLALAVAQAIDAREALVAEAGTGVGKTYAYLAPALLSGKRTLVSTATKP